ncbi:hypothetical protein Ae505Ps2_5951c [Pseudonocardia sp. Ae505_Ps2]|nr:hypothetical protein Ae505Ps2_5951c [Pseudonocardia sp. Ae505_Ps2]
MKVSSVWIRLQHRSIGVEHHDVMSKRCRNSFHEPHSDNGAVRRRH